MGFGSYKTPLKLLKSRPVRKMNSRLVKLFSTWSSYFLCRSDLFAYKDQLRRQTNSSRQLMITLVNRLSKVQQELDMVRIYKIILNLSINFRRRRRETQILSSLTSNCVY